jgi:hypothetical protein
MKLAIMDEEIYTWDSVGRSYSGSAINAMGNAFFVVANE